MSKKKSYKKKGKYEEMLEPMVYDKGISSHGLSNYIDISKTELVISDYDWMNYTLSVELTTKEYGELKIKFEDFGVGLCEMEVETVERKHIFSFDGNIFIEYIIRLLRKQIRNWSEGNAFSDIGDIVSFYNAVITSPKTRYEGSKIKRIH